MKSVKARRWFVAVGAVIGLSVATPAHAADLSTLESLNKVPDVTVNSTTQAQNFTISADAGNGYWEFASDGGVFAYGDAQFAGSAVGITDSPIVAAAKTATGKGYWLVNDLGGVFSFGDAAFYGSAHNIALQAPITGIARSQGGNGYYLVAADGGVFTFGDAQFKGSAADLHVAQHAVKFQGAELPNLVTSITPAPGEGYWLQSFDGGVFAYDAPFYGSANSAKPNFPTVGLQSSVSGIGYWQYSFDGGVFTSGDATSHFYGSAVDDVDVPLVLGFDRSKTGNGYWFAQIDGRVISKGDAVSYGQASDLDLEAPIVSLVRSGS